MAGIPTGLELPVLHDFVIFHDALNYATAASWLCGYIALLQKLRRDRSAIGLSMQTLTALVISECNTLIIILLFYLLNHIEFGIGFVLCDVATVVVSAWTLLIIHRKFSNSYEEDRDVFGMKFCLCSPKARQQIRGKRSLFQRRMHWGFLYILSAALALPIFFLRRQSMPHWLSYFECFDDVLAALALLPQLFMFYSKRPRRVSQLLGRFVIFLLLARVCSFAFWLTDPLFRIKTIPGRGVHLVSELMNVAILSNFTYYYFTASYKGLKDINLPL